MDTLKKLMEIDITLDLIDLTLVPTNESKEKVKNMKNCGVKSEI